MEVVDVEHTFLLAVGLLMCKKDSDTAKIAESAKNNRIVSLSLRAGFSKYLEVFCLARDIYHRRFCGMMQVGDRELIKCNR